MLARRRCAATTVGALRRRIAARLAEHSLRPAESGTPRPRCAPARRAMRSAATPNELVLRDDRAGRRRRLSGRAWRSPSGGAPASRWRASSARRNSGACRFGLSPATLVPRPDTETLVEAALGGDRRARPARGAAPHPRSRHRAAVRSCWRCSPSCRARAASASTSAGGAARRRGTTPQRLGLGRAGAVRGRRLGGAGRRPIRSSSPIRPISQAARHRRRCRLRSAATIPIWRSTAGRRARRLSRDLSPISPRLLAPGGMAFLEIGAGQAEAVSAHGRRQRLACSSLSRSGRDRVAIVAPKSSW